MKEIKIITTIGKINPDTLGTHKEVFNALKAQINFEEITSQEQLDIALKQRVDFGNTVEEQIAKNKARIAEIESQEIKELKAQNKVLENAYEVVKETIDQSAIKFIDTPREDVLDIETGIITTANEPTINFGLTIAKKATQYGVTIEDKNALWEFINSKCEHGVYKVEELGIALELLSLNTKELEKFAKDTKGQATIPGLKISTINGKILKFK